MRGLCPSQQLRHHLAFVWTNTEMPQKKSSYSFQLGHTGGVTRFRGSHSFPSSKFDLGSNLQRRTHATPTPQEESPGLRPWGSVAASAGLCPCVAHPGAWFSRPWGFEFRWTPRLLNSYMYTGKLLLCLLYGVLTGILRVPGGYISQDDTRSYYFYIFRYLPGWGSLLLCLLASIWSWGAARWSHRDPIEQLGGQVA